MNTARSKHSAALLSDGRVLLVGGRTAAGDPLSSGEIFAGANFIGVGGMEDTRFQPLAGAGPASPLTPLRLRRGNEGKTTRLKLSN
jgi:hypothetical protein